MSADRIAALLQSTDAAVPHPGPGAPFDPAVARRRLLRRTAGRLVGATAVGTLATLCALHGFGTAASAAHPASSDAPAFAPVSPGPSLAERLLEASRERWHLGEDRILERVQSDASRRLMQSIETNLARARAAQWRADDAVARSRAIAAYSSRPGSATPRNR